MAMKKVFFLFTGCWLLATGSLAQTVSQKLQKAFQQFESDSQLRHAISSLYVIDAKTGNVVFERNAQVGLAPASTQKIITSVTAFELLGKDYRYKTTLGYTGKINSGILSGNLYLTGSGDPTLGSWRYASTAPEFYYQEIANAIKNYGIKKIPFIKEKPEPFLFLDATRFSSEISQDGWIWQDIGNYYGANAIGLNWRENQYTFRFIPGDEGEAPRIDTIIPGYAQSDPIRLTDIITGKKGSGDNAYFYLNPREGAVNHYTVRGSIPAGVKFFDVSASHYDPVSYFQNFLIDNWKKKKDSVFFEIGLMSVESPSYKYMKGHDTEKLIIYTHYSPSLDSIIYWFNKKSINLYGEALVKTFAYEKTGFGSTDTGVAIVKKFWNQKGLEEDELNIYDGSGLSPLNRVTTHAQVEILKYAKTRDWFPSFYDALPEYNGMKMKSGTISDVKGFCGYHTAKDGKEYIFSFLVNNYSGRASQLVSKMYKVLEVLK